MPLSDAQIKKLLSKQLALPENRKCADCPTRAPRWASATIGCFICIKCSGIHRKRGTHLSFVRSVSLDTWKEKEAKVMRDDDDENEGDGADSESDFEPSGSEEESDFDESGSESLVESDEDDNHDDCDDPSDDPILELAENTNKEFVKG